MAPMRKTHDAHFKAKVALEAVKGEKTITEIATEFSVHPQQIRQWRAQLLERIPDMFSQRKAQQEKSVESGRRITRLRGLLRSFTR